MYNANTVNSYMMFALCVVLFIAVLAVMDLRANGGMPAAILNLMSLYYGIYDRYKPAVLFIQIFTVGFDFTNNCVGGVRMRSGAHIIRTQPPTPHRRGITKFNQTSYPKTKRGRVCTPHQ